MKLLWYVNILMPAAAAHFGLPSTNGGGWLVGQAARLARYGAGGEPAGYAQADENAPRPAGISLSILHATPLVKQPQRVTLSDGITYLLVPADAQESCAFSEVMLAEKADIVHIFGTEYHYNVDMIAACRAAKQPYVVSLQGIMPACARHYADGLPARFSRVDPLVRLMKKVYYADSIELARRDFAARGAAEQAALAKCPYIIGRTAWDQAYAEATAPQARYFKVNENLRDAFYTGERWAYEHCRPYSIFVSQAFYPIKGFHQLLKILPRLIERYPGLKVFVGGQAAYSLGNAFLDRAVDRFFEYQRYIKQEIRKNGLAPYIEFLGPLDAEGMKRQYLAANLFLSPSTIENSPNSVGEAMLLGVPVAASRVGGTPSLLADGQDGILYDFDDLDAMQAAICTLLDHPETAACCGMHAAAHAARTHDREKNTKELLQVYEYITENNRRTKKA